jgi:hypothetical protein
VALWSKDKQPAEKSAAPLSGMGAARDDVVMPVLVEIRDLLKEQAEFNTWLKERLIANGTLP